MHRHARTVASAALAVALTACGGSIDGAVAGQAPQIDHATPGTAGQLAEPPTIDNATGASAADDQGHAQPAGDRLVVRVVGQRPHDATAFTQGLEFDGDRLFESRGLYGQSAMTEIDPATGEVIARTDLDSGFFGEGMTIIDDRAIQITWQENTAFIYDRDTLEQIGTLPYEGEGWGICDADGVLFMSNGTATLTQRDPLTFLPINTVTVTLDGGPVQRLNELECAGGLVWANVWLTNTIVVIEPSTGEVVATIDASPIAQADGKWLQEPGAADVLNGIAYDAANDVWLITGKQWPVIYEVEFDAADSVASAPAYYGRSWG